MPEIERLDVEECTVHLRGVRLPMGLRIDDLRVYGRGIQLIRTPFSIATEVAGRLECTVSEASLAAFLEALQPAGLKEFQVRADQGKLEIRAVKQVLIASIPALATCHLEIREQHALYVVLDSVELAGGTSIKQLVQSQLDKLNPIVDASMLPIGSGTLDEVTVRDGQVIVEGSVRP